MKPKTKIIIVSSAIILLGGIMVIKYLKNRSKKPTEDLGFPIAEEISINQPKSQTIKTKLVSVSSFPLQKGSVGLEVQYLQNWLNKNNFVTKKLDEDGKFGVLTENAVKAMQAKPKFLDIIEYKNQEAFTDPMKAGIISRKFYDYFIIKSKKYIKTQSGFNLNLQ